MLSFTVIYQTPDISKSIMDYGSFKPLWSIPKGWIFKKYFRVWIINIIYYYLLFMSMETLFTEKHIWKQFHVNITYCPIMHLKNECIGTTKCFGADIIYPYVFRTLYVLNINLIYPRSLFTELHKLDFFISVYYAKEPWAPTRPI